MNRTLLELETILRKNAYRQTDEVVRVRVAPVVRELKEYLEMRESEILNEKL